MKFVVTAGGTAGHVNPALAVAQELRERGHQILFAGTPQGIESQLVPLAAILAEELSNESGRLRLKPEAVNA